MTTAQRMNRLIHLLKSKPPDIANGLLKTQLKDLLPAEISAKYEKLRNEELFHIQHVRKCMDTLRPQQAPNQHDHSKNELYFFVTICHFNLSEQCEIPKTWLQEIIKEHYRQEAHHPEYESLNPQSSIGDSDIMEMSIDRLSRNLQKNGGEYNPSQLIKFSPKFEKNHKARSTLYYSYISSLQPLVKQIWWDLKKTPIETEKMDKTKSKRVTINEDKNEEYEVPREDESRDGSEWLFAAADRAREKRKKKISAPPSE